MQVKEILKKNIPENEKESQLAALFSYSPPTEEVKHDEFYSGLEDIALSTSFSDYFKIHQDLKGCLIDYGAGFCKGSLLFNVLGEKSCYSFEVLESRVSYAKECFKKNNLKPDTIIQRDLIQGEVPLGENYLIYQPLGKVFFRLLSVLYKVSQSVTFYIIESHGDVLPYINELKCFEKIKEFDSQSLRHINGIHKYLFKPSLVEDSLYTRYFTHYDDNFYIHALDGDIEFKCCFDETLPIIYNDRPCIELKTSRRILDQQILKLKTPNINIV